MLGPAWRQTSRRTWHPTWHPTSPPVFYAPLGARRHRRIDGVRHRLPEYHSPRQARVLAADYGVTCDGSGRVSSWANRGTLGTQIMPVPTKNGPLCNSTTPLGGRNAVYFDASRSDEASGLLQLNLNTALSGNDYTIFVVERRQSAAEGYFLGTALNPAFPLPRLHAMTADLSLLVWLQTRPTLFPGRMS